MDTKLYSRDDGKEDSFQLISVIVPVYNVLPYIDQCVESLLAQTYKRIEIMLIDDGSSDGSGERCDHWQGQDDRIRVIHQENGGVSAARNTGLEAARGAYLGFVDPDDYVCPEMMERLMDAVLDGDADMAICDYQETDTRSAGHGDHAAAGVYSGRELIAMMLDKKVCVNLWNKLYRTGLWDGIRFPEGRTYEDLAVAHLIFSRTGKCRVIEDKLYFYRNVREGSIIDTLSMVKIEDCTAGMTEQRDFIVKNYPEFSAEARSRFAIHCIGVWHRASRKGSGCTKEYRKALKKQAFNECRYLKTTDLQHWLLIVMMAVCPGLSVRIHQALKH